MKHKNMIKFILIGIFILIMSSCSNDEIKSNSNMYGFNPERTHSIKEKDIINKPNNLVWKFILDDGYHLNYPIMDDGVIVFKAKNKIGGGNDIIYALNDVDGKILYRLKSNRISEPLIYKGLLYYAESDGATYFHAADSKSGEERWFYKTTPKSEFDVNNIEYPLIYKDNVYFMDESFNAVDAKMITYIYKLNSKDGKLNLFNFFETSVKDFNEIFSKSPDVLYKDNLFIPSLSYKKIKVLDINLGSYQYEFDSKGKILDMAAGEDFLYICGEKYDSKDGFVIKFEPYIGDRRWKKNFQDCSINGISTDEKVIYLNATSQNGSSIYAVDSLDGKIIWQKDYKDSHLSDIIIAKKMAYVSGDDGIYCFDKKTGEAIWKYEGEIGEYTAPLIHGEKIYFGLDNYFYCIK